jgi:hypothetical protein
MSAVAASRKILSNFFSAKNVSTAKKCSDLHLKCEPSAGRIFSRQFLLKGMNTYIPFITLQINQL